MTLPILHKVTFGAGASDFYYIKTSDAYETIKAQTGLEKVADPTGTEEVIPVKELLRTGIIWRIGIHCSLNPYCQRLPKFHKNLGYRVQKIIFLTVTCNPS
ncbi:hypothetical protein [Nostoc sp.]|uniref:hypothetical protein n=1 Tax=Nostoc sp. TaxID=1180 RepID=UPI002FFC192D